MRLVSDPELHGDRVIAPALGAQRRRGGSKTLIRGCRNGVRKDILQE